MMYYQSIVLSNTNIHLKHIPCLLPDTKRFYCIFWSHSGCSSMANIKDLLAGECKLEDGGGIAMRFVDVFREEKENSAGEEIAT